MSRVILPTAAVITLVILAALAPATARAENWSKIYETGAGADLQVLTDDANVHLVGWSEPRIRIDVEAEGWKLGSGGLRVFESQAGSQVRFELREPHFEFHFFDVGRRAVHIEVHAPLGTRLELKTGDGNVGCEGIAGPARISTGDGNITVDGCRGEVTLHTGDGRVDARELDGSLVASTGDGRVRLGGRFDALDVSTSDGGVTLDIAPGSRVSAGWSVRSGDGPVVLRLPSELKTTLDVHSGDGGITVDVPVRMLGAMRDNTLHATMNGGGPELRVRTGDGSIVIEPYAEESADARSDGAWDDKRASRHGVRLIKHSH